MVITAAVILLLVAIDRASKVFLSVWLADKGLVTVIPKVLGLRLLEGGNSGAAFGMLSGNTGILIVITVIVMLVLLYVLAFKRFSSRILYISALLITAGGIGNLYDRIAYGYVTDFFELLFMNFAVFNVADCYITVGAALVIIYMIFSKNNGEIFAGDKPKER